MAALPGDATPCLLNGKHLYPVPPTLCHTLTAGSAAFFFFFGVGSAHSESPDCRARVTGTLKTLGGGFSSSESCFHLLGYV